MMVSEGRAALGGCDNGAARSSPADPVHLHHRSPIVVTGPGGRRVESDSTALALELVSLRSVVYLR